ncbi:hypothetical protein COL26_24120 [Bacillus thuringiensis]|uniref:Uncharacterized protein n=1 Tax=Bacillus thuringiensis TaxID=1428 RepID=A0ABD6S1C6_BACTU|nr:hypothetical protein [Bacillus thuringiensis]PER43868.1 hypothetical protein CN495_30300 [Bacillus thuringiensis]PEU96426.1 hypothetical protein CN411_02500 [Bacillus thuringiensis]PFI03268.1 hypothetical protein COI79_29475 [Bacillus thuringiensis]PFW33205.1 hypothetical protein COL26_24120 [Bacillus thuringiensis]PGY75549.1 hypothetical protein COE44_19600 [Bacillus thuringiensis]
MKYIKWFLLFTFIIGVSWFIKVQFLNSIYLSSLTDEEQSIYYELKSNHDVAILKDSKPETVLKVYLHSVDKGDYEISYGLTNTISTKESYVTERKKANSDAYLIEEFRFIDSKFTYTSKYSGYFKVRNGKEFLMFKRDGIWKVEEVAFQ